MTIYDDDDDDSPRVKRGQPTKTVIMMIMIIMMMMMMMMMMLMVMEVRPRVDWLWRSYRRILYKLSKESRQATIRISLVSFSSNIVNEIATMTHKYVFVIVIVRYNRDDFAVEMLTTVSEENIFPMVNINGRQVVMMLVMMIMLRRMTMRKRMVMIIMTRMLVLITLIATLVMIMTMFIKLVYL